MGSENAQNAQLDRMSSAAGSFDTVDRCGDTECNQFTFYPTNAASQPVRFWQSVEDDAGIKLEAAQTAKDGGNLHVNVSFAQWTVGSPDSIERLSTAGCTTAGPSPVWDQIESKDNAVYVTAAL